MKRIENRPEVRVNHFQIYFDMQMNLLRLFLFLVILTVFAPAFGQNIPGLQEASPVVEAESPDLLNRQTPNGTFFGFLEAVENQNLQIAAEYLQLSTRKKKSTGTQLAEQLQAVLEHGLSGGLPKTSTDPNGTIEEGVPIDRERIAQAKIGDLTMNVDLVSVEDRQAGKIWLFAKDTLAKVPELYAVLQKNQAASSDSKSLLDTVWFKMPIRKWLALLGGIPAAAALAWLLMVLGVLPFRLWQHIRKPSTVKRWHDGTGPVWLILAIVINAVLMVLTDIPILYRHYYFIGLKIAFAFGVAWLLVRILTGVAMAMRIQAVKRGRPETGSMILLGQRLLKLMVVVSAGLGILRLLGFDMGAALAGLGIGGLAISFGAQKTIENLFAGVSVLGDDVIRVGDFCKIGDQFGTVEDISMRSIRFRTLERTELSIPNGNLATSHVENLSRRDKIFFNPVLGLRYETSADQMRYVLAELRRLLYQHPKVETGTARARFTGYGDSALTVEIYSYVLTRDFPEYTAIREDLLLRIMEIVAESGTGFAFPSRTIYFGKDQGLDQNLTAMAEHKTRKWRDDNKLPFPDFAPKEIEAINDALPYPESESVLNPS